MTVNNPDELAKRITETLAQPIDFPPLSAAIIQDDRLALAIDEHAAAIPMVIPALLRSIAAMPVSAVDVVLSSATPPEDVESIRQTVERHRGHYEHLAVCLDRHDGGDRTVMSYLIADQNADPIYISKPLADADVVLPVRTMDTHADSAGSSANDTDAGLFPAFVDHETSTRSMDDPSLRPSPGVAWSLGVQLELVLVTGPDGDIETVRAQSIAKVAA